MSDLEKKEVKNTKIEALHALVLRCVMVQEDEQKVLRYVMVQENEKNQIVNDIINIKEQALNNGDHETVLEAIDLLHGNPQMYSPEVYNSVKALQQKWFNEKNYEASLAASHCMLFNTEEETEHKEIFDHVMAIKKEAIKEGNSELAFKAIIQLYHCTDDGTVAEKEVQGFLDEIDITDNEKLETEIQEFRDKYFDKPESEKTPEDGMNAFLKNLEEFAEIHGTAPGNQPTPNP